MIQLLNELNAKLKKEHKEFKELNQKFNKRTLEIKKDQDKDFKELEIDYKELELILIRLFISLDCGDNSCRFKDYPNKIISGMRTNGSCRCINTRKDHTLAIDLTKIFKKITK